MAPIVLMSLVLAASNPVLVETDSRTALGRSLCGVTGDPRVTVEEGTLVVPRDAPPRRLEVAFGDCHAPNILPVWIVPPTELGATTTWLFPDEGRLELRGGVLTHAIIWWRPAPNAPWRTASCAGGLSGVNDGAAKTCSIPISTEDVQLSRGGETLEVLKLPPGSPEAEGSGRPELWRRAQGQRSTPLDALRAPLAGMVLSGPLVHATSVEAWSEHSDLPLSVPGVIASVHCRPGQCWQSQDRASLVVVPLASGEGIVVTVTLRERVFMKQGDAITSTVSFTIPLAQCQVRPLINAVLGGTSDHRLPVALGDRCPSNLAALSVETTPPSAAYVESVVGGEVRRLDVRLGHVPLRSDILEIRILHAATRSVVGSSRVQVRTDFTPSHIVLLDPEIGEAPFIPTNREARIQWATSAPALGPSVSPISLPGYYTVRRQGGESMVRGETRTEGTVPIRFAYLAPGDEHPLVVFDSDVRFPIRPMNVPVSLAAEASRTGGLFAVLCRTGNAEKEVAPSSFASLPFSARGTCHLRVDPRVLLPADGTQRVRVSVQVTNPSGAARGGGLSQVMVLTAGKPVDSVSLGFNETMRPFDHLTVSLAHDDQVGHYLKGGEAISLPARRYQMVFGDARARLYASATVPTGLYRITRASDGGLLQFSGGALFRMAALDREGHEFPIDLEFALLGTNLSGHADLSLVAGLGVTVPLLNPQEAAQAAIGIHAWVEYAPTRGTNWKRPFALIFGPSISLGDFGINL